jgi:predicted signal transduction protein with EAL and GGDEF domain
MNATVSIGIAESPADLANVGALLSRADRALYAAKASGRNRICTEREARTAPVEAPSLAPEAIADSHHGLGGNAIPAMP